MHTSTLLLNLLTTSLLSLPLLSSANKPQPVLRAQLSPFRPLNPLQPRQDSFCDGINCGNFCVPNGYHCCSDGGAGCPIGSTCIPNGCCPNGETCDGGGGTVTFPGGSAPAPTSFDSGPEPSDTFSSDSFSFIEPSTTPAATGKKTTAAGGGAAATSEDAYDSYLATAYATTAAGGAAASSFAGDVSGVSFPSFSSPTFDVTGVPGGDNVPSATSIASASAASSSPKSGGSSGGSPQEVAAGAERVGGGVVVTACLVVGGLVAVWVF